MAELDARLTLLDDRQVEWLSGHTGWSRAQVEDRGHAARLAAELGEPGKPLESEPIYGLLRYGFPRAADELLLRPAASIRAALSAAQETNIVGLNVMASKLLSAIQAARVRDLLTDGPESLGAILSTSRELGQRGGLNSLQVIAVCRLVATSNGSDEELWKGVEALQLLGDDDRAEVRRLVQLGTIGLGHAPTVKAILEVLGTGEASEVGGWVEGQWQKVSGRVNPLPTNLPGEDDASQRRALASLLDDHAKQAFPGAALRGSLVGEVGRSLGVREVLARPVNASLDLRTARLHGALDLGSVDAQKTSELRALRRTQRLVRIAPEVGAAQAIDRLAKMEISSARGVARMGRTRFIDVYSRGKPELRDEAREIFCKSTSQTAAAGAFFLAAHPALGQTKLKFVTRDTTVEVTDEDVPGWSEFMTPKGTRCAWCQSIHGPSAYFVDLLGWLQGRTNPAGAQSGPASALVVLMKRRPDLGNLPLTCENAERVLPYIDLTLEVLEAAVTGGLGVANSSDADTADMLAAPQYMNPAAYGAAKLGDYTRAFTTPFHQPLEEARSFLLHLGVPRAKLMRAFATAVAENEILRSYYLAIEELGLSVEGAAAITSNEAEPSYWSLSVPPTQQDALTVAAFRRAAEIGYEDILDLLHTRLVNPTRGAGEIVVLMRSGADVFDVSNYSLLRMASTAPSYQALDEGAFQRMRKVLRLWKATGWSLLDLDRVCNALGLSVVGVWDDRTLIAIGELHRLTRITELNPVELAGWFGGPDGPHGTLDTYADRATRDRPSPSLYDRTFLNRSLFPQAAQDTTSFPFALKEESGDGVEVASPRPVLDELARLRAVLRMDEQELAGLVAALQSFSVIEGDAQTDLRTLGILYRWTSLARVLGVRPTELLRQAVLLGYAPSATDAGPFQSPGTTTHLIESVRGLLDGGWSIDELEYLVRDERREAVAPTEDWLRGVLGRLRDTARGLSADLHTAARVDAFARQLAEEFGVPVAMFDVLQASLRFPALTGDGGEALLSRFLRPEFVSVPEAEVETGDGSSDSGEPVNIDDPWSDITRGSTIWEGDFAVLDAVHKVVLLASKLGATPDDLAAVVAAADRWSLFGPQLLTSLDAVTEPPTPFERLWNTIELFRQRRRLPGRVPSFAAIIREPTAQSVAERTGWDAAALRALFDGGVASVANFVNVLDRLEIVRRLGASVDVVAGWAAPGDLTNFTSEKARQVVAAARARHGSPGAWGAVARPIRDPVRKAQRDALVSYLLAEDAISGGALRDAEGLYQHYLIDVSMNPEMLTSRIVQASATVQLFIHRCLFGLEASGEDGEDVGDFFNDEDRAEWEWMRTYRVWEAARKVFLYPENWIEPELRDDKTPFFLSLERELSQGDVTDDRVEQVTLDYLDRLLQVASLKVLACYVERNGSTCSESAERIHVFARTYGDPATYWYRRRETTGTWTAWEEVKAGIEGEHLIPVVYNRRLMLFWAEFIETQSEKENASPASWWEIRLAVSEYRDGKWSPKRLGGQPLSLRRPKGKKSKLTKSSYSFVSSIGSDGLLRIRCVAADVAGWWSEYESKFSDLGAFTLDPCTMDLHTSSKSSSEGEPKRVALAPAVWVAPGFVASNYTWADALNNLDVYVGSVDADGFLAGRASPVDVLNRATNTLAVVPSQFNDFVSQSPFFVQVGERGYFVEPRRSRQLRKAVASKAPSIRAVDAYREGTGGLRAKRPTSLNPASPGVSLNQLQAAPATGWTATYRFWNFYHPFVCRYVSEVRRRGVFGLLDPDPDGDSAELFRQVLKGEESKSFESLCLPTSRVEHPRPLEDIDFSLEGAYSQYNWEIFFHLPFFVANRLADAGRYQEAVSWFHTMFDPRTRKTVEASGFEGALANGTWWKVKPFVESVSRPVTDWIGFTGADGSADAQSAFEAQVTAWREDPFNPHLLARLRSGTYQRSLVMRYLDTLIAWGDQLFTQDTLETINEATQLYVFAKQVLGDRPELLGDIERSEPKSWNELKATVDDFGNPLVGLENASFQVQGQGSSGGELAVLAGLGLAPYFCVPFNARLLSYWDTLDDRLLKIRNGMNIAGVARSLPLFQPPIDPAMLVRAAAAGVNIGAALGDAANLGNYRFNVMLGRAQALAGSVRALGQALLSAIEKRDAEALALLRQTHEGALLDAVKGVREQQIEEAKEGLAGLRRSRKTVEARHDYYDRLIGKGWIAEEESAVALSATADLLTAVSGTMSGIGGILGVLPDISVGLAAAIKAGGDNANRLLNGLAGLVGAGASLARGSASLLTTTASYRRRAQDWKHQRILADKELAALDKQILGAEIRVEIAKRELKNHELQIRHSAEVRDWMERKFTNHELYDWMVGQLATLHFQSWQLALSTAKKAEACYRHELGRDDTFVRPVHWDGTRKGLLAGERLELDLQRMDQAYLDNDVREQELVKQVSLARLDSLALVRLRAEGECYFEVPEVLFDLDCPGHYNRRLVAVAVTVACVSGPQGQVNTRLTLRGSSVRKTSQLGADHLEEERSTYPSITTSGALEDSGLFSNDPGSPRYLPFERKGAISSWHLAFANQKHPQFDWNSVSDVVLHLRYTARDGGDDYREDVIDHIDPFTLAGGFAGAGTESLTSRFTVGVSAKRDDPDAWFKAKQEGSSGVSLRLGTQRLPYFAAVLDDVKVSAAHVLVIGRQPADCRVKFAGGTESASTFTAWPADGSGVFSATVGAGLPGAWPESVDITALGDALAEADDLVLILEVSVGA